MKSYLQRWFPNLFRSKAGGIVEPKPEPRVEVRYEVVKEVKFTDIEHIPLYVVHVRKHGLWQVLGYTDRERDVRPFIDRPDHQVKMTMGHRIRSGGGFNNLLKIDRAVVVERLPALID